MLMELELINGKLQTVQQVAQILQEWRFGSLHEVGNYDKPTCLLRTKGRNMHRGKQEDTYKS